LNLRVFADLIVGVFSVGNLETVLPRRHEDMSNKAEEYPSKRFNDWGKIRFEPHDNQLLFPQE